MDDLVGIISASCRSLSTWDVRNASSLHWAIGMRRTRFSCFLTCILGAILLFQCEARRNSERRRFDREQGLKKHEGNKHRTGIEHVNVALVFTLHGALEYFELALASLAKHTRPRWGRLHIFAADDCANHTQSLELQRLLQGYELPSTVVPMGPVTSGYTRSVNAGLRQAMEGDFQVIVVLNSDLVFGPFWLEPLVSALLSNPTIGIVGPLGNAASFQSVPDLTNAKGRWSTNPLLPGWTPRYVSLLAQKISKDKLFSVPILNGFAMAFHRQVFETVGLMDEIFFPMGYGEENEFAFRAASAGFKLAVQPSSYIFHHKTKSFTSEERQNFGSMAKEVLKEKMGPQLDAALEVLKTCPLLDQERRWFGKHLKTMLPAVQKSFSVLFILNIMPEPKAFVLRGGWISIVQESVGLALAGAHVQMAVQEWTVPHFQKAFPSMQERFFVGFSALTPREVGIELEGQHLAFDFFVATHFSTVETVLHLCKVYPSSVKAYYVQDIETNFQSNNHRAALSYYSMSNAFVFVKTKFIRRQLMQHYKIQAHLVPPTVNTTLFLPTEENLQRRDDIKPYHVCAMIRTLTPRRQPLKTLEVILTTMQSMGKERLTATVYGTTLGEVHRLLQNHPMFFPLISKLHIKGVLSRDPMAELYHTCTFFLDFSSWQAFGRSGLEAMTAGCIPILPIYGGSSTYAKDGVNALLVDTANVSAGVKALSDLVNGKYNIPTMRSAAIETGRKYDVQVSSRRTGSIFKRFLFRWQLKRAMSMKYELQSCTAPQHE